MRRNNILWVLCSSGMRSSYLINKSYLNNSAVTMDSFRSFTGALTTIRWNWQKKGLWEKIMTAFKSLWIQPSHTPFYATMACYDAGPMWTGFDCYNYYYIIQETGVFDYLLICLLNVHLLESYYKRPAARTPR